MRTAMKRKSESALSLGAVRRTSTSPSPEPEHQSSDGIFIQDAPVAAKHVKKRARKSEPARKTRADDEYDEDVGRTESQTFLALIEFESKKKRTANKENKEYMDSFEKGVKDEEERLSSLIAEGEKAARKRESQFLDTFNFAYGASRSQVSVPQPDPSTGPTQNFATMYKKSREITATAFALVAKFEEVEEQVSGIDNTALLQNSWISEDETLAHVMTEGKRLGIERYRCLLMAIKERDLEKEERGNAKTFFGEQEKARGWGKVVKKQEKAFQKLAKTVEIVAENEVEEIA